MRCLNDEAYHHIIELKSGDEFIVKDNRGFQVFRVDESGNVKHKGRMEKR